MKRCVDSGLWKPAADDPNTNPEDGFKKRSDDENDGQEAADAPAAADQVAEENIYEKPN